MKKRKTFGSSIFIIVCLLPILFQGCCDGRSAKDDAAGNVRADSLEIVFADSLTRIRRERQLNDDTIRIGKLFSDTAKLKKQVVTEWTKIHRAGETFYGKEIAKKNSEIFSSKRKLAKVKDNKGQVWTLIAIILATGAVGGFVGSKFPLLGDNLIKDLTNVAEKSKSLTQNLKKNQHAIGLLDDPAGFQNTIDQAESATTDLENKIQELKEEKLPWWGYILFGVISAALSFIALDAINSKILDFKFETDYFIFAGYCLLAAVFAKSWILRLYKTISKG